MVEFAEIGCPIFRAATPWSTGQLNSKGHGQLSIHYAADQETIEIIFSHNCFCESAQSLRSSCEHVWRIWIVSRENGATRCDGTIKFLNRAQCDEDRSSFGLWWPSEWKISIATIWRMNWEAVTTRQIDKILYGFRISECCWESVFHYERHWRIFTIQYCGLSWIHSSKRRNNITTERMDPGEFEQQRQKFLKISSRRICVKTECKRFCMPIKGKSKTTKNRTCWFFIKFRSLWKEVWYWTREIFFLRIRGVEESNSFSSSFTTSASRRRRSGSFLEWRKIFRIHSHNLFIGGTIDGKHVWQQEEEQKGDSSIVLIFSGTIVYFRALQGHSGRTLIDLSLQDIVIIQCGLFHHIYHILCACQSSFYHQQWIDTWRSGFKQETDSILLSYWSLRQRCIKILHILTSLYHFVHNICTVLGRNIKTLYFRLILILRFEKDWHSIKHDRMQLSFKEHFQLVVSHNC